MPGMPIFALLLIVAGIWLVVWFLNKFIIQQPIGQQIVIGLAVALSLGIILQACGVFHYITDVKVPQI
jgi:hypothetical protein